MEGVLPVLTDLGWETKDMRVHIQLNRDLTNISTYDLLDNICLLILYDPVDVFFFIRIV